MSYDSSKVERQCANGQQTEHTLNKLKENSVPTPNGPELHDRTFPSQQDEEEIVVSSCAVPGQPIVIPPSDADSEHEEENNHLDTSDIAPDEQPPKRPRAVRFYSRVRITSGVGHSTKSPHKSTSTHSNEQLSASIRVPSRRPSSSTESSSASGSYSSSISAPLRTSSELPPRIQSVRLKASKVRRPISDIVDTQETVSWLHSLAVERRGRREAKKKRIVDERSALLPPNNQNTDEEEEITPAKTERDSQFGPWPWRIFSLYVSQQAYHAQIINAIS